MSGRRNKGERGATLVETAIVFPLVALLTFALIDGSLVMKGYLSAGYSAKAAARAVTARANQSGADYLALQAIQKARFGVEPGSIERIVIFKADSLDAKVPPPCMTPTFKGSNDKCNVYVEADLARPLDDYDESSPWRAPQYWPGWSRNGSRSGNPDYVGVAVQVRQASFAGLFSGGPLLITRTSVLQIEARTR